MRQIILKKIILQLYYPENFGINKLVGELTLEKKILIAKSGDTDQNFYL